MALKENYKDDILDTSQNVKRKYQMENNGDGTVSFTDVTEYTQQGDSFGASDMNATNGKVNTLDSAVTTLNANLDGFKFYPTGTGIVGLIADDSAYTDEDGNYVVWGTPTANQLVEDNPNTYKSLASTEDTRGEVGADTAIPFSREFISETAIINSNTRTVSNLTVGRKYIVFTSTQAVNLDGIQSGGTVLYNYTGNDPLTTNNVKMRVFSFVAESTSVTFRFSWDQASGTNRIVCIPLTDD